MGLDFHGTWHARNADGTFETLSLGEDEHGHDVSDPGRSGELYSMFGLEGRDADIPRIRQTAAPAELNVRQWPGAPAQGCVTLSDLLAYDYEAPAWQREKYYIGSGHMPVSLASAYLRHVTLERVKLRAQGREVFCTYVIG